jgi:ABC-type transporter Mla MlaB component
MSFAARRLPVQPAGAIKPMLKIETVRNGSGTVTLILEGQLIGLWVDELRLACARARRARARVAVDLGGVAFVDRDGVALLRELADHGTRMSSCSPFVAEQLKTQER